MATAKKAVKKVPAKKVARKASNGIFGKRSKKDDEPPPPPRRTKKIER